MPKNKLIVAIDEVGRGAVAGPLVLGAVFAENNQKNKKLLKGIKDSKKLTFNQRIAWFKKFKKSSLKFYTAFVSNKVIDKKGMAQAIRIGINKLFKKIKTKPDLVLLDGGLKAPKNFRQKTIIKGDEKNPFIAAASIYAKVKRDLYMIELDKKFNYSFKDHKGYGTKNHFKLILKNGISEIHRQSFLGNLNIVKK